MHGPVAKLVAIATAGSLAVSLATTAVEARSYTRSCHATYAIGAATPSGTRLVGASYRFSGSGTVGWYAPNKARERALRNINECVTAAWAHRLGTSTPSACTSGNQISGYPFTGLHFGMMQAVCRANRGHDRIMVNLYVTYSGNTGCVPRGNNWSRTITQSYTINCPDYQAGPLY